MQPANVISCVTAFITEIYTLCNIVTTQSPYIKRNEKTFILKNLFTHNSTKLTAQKPFIRQLFVDEKHLSSSLIEQTKTFK